MSEYLKEKIQDFILARHWAGKKHVMIIREVKREFNREVSRKDIIDLILKYSPPSEISKH